MMLVQLRPELELIWQVIHSITSALCVICILLIIWHFISYTQRTSGYVLQKRIESVLISILTDASRTKKISFRLKDMTLVAAVVTRLLTILNGAPRQKLLEIFDAIGLDNWITQNLCSKQNNKCMLAINLSLYYSNIKIRHRLSALLSNKNPLVQRMALRSLMNRPDHSLFTLVIEVFKANNSFSPLVIYDTFQKFDARSLQYVKDIIVDKLMPNRIKIAALMVLNRIESATYIRDTVIPFCLDEDSDIRAAAFFAIKRLGSLMPQCLLDRGKNDAYWLVRRQIVDCARYSSPVNTYLLLHLLEDKNWEVRIYAAEAILMENMVHAISQTEVALSDGAKIALEMHGWRSSVVF